MQPLFELALSLVSLILLSAATAKAAPHNHRQRDRGGGGGRKRRQPSIAPSKPRDQHVDVHHNQYFALRCQNTASDAIYRHR